MKTKPIKLIQMFGVMLLTLFIVSCSKDDTVKVDKTALMAGISAANTTIAAALEGSAAGQYQNGSKAELQSAIDAAQAVASNASATKDEVAAALANLTAAVTTFGGKIITAIDPSNLVGQWTFDEITTVTAGSVVKDYSGNSHDGAIKVGHVYFGSGTAALTTDRFGVANKALLLDKGANVEIPYNTALNPPSLSISAWVKLAEVRNNRFVGLQSWIGYKFEVQDGNKPFATIGHSGGSYDRDAVVTINQAQWYHLVVTYTAGSMVFYVNGIMVKEWNDTPNAAASISAKPYNLVLGCDFPTDKYSSDANGTNFDNVASPDYRVIPAAWGGYIHGSLDEVRIYKSVLTASQVTSIYNQEKP